MLKLRTVYPYGLNDRIGDEYKPSQSHSFVGHRFPRLERNFDRLSRGNNRVGNNKLSPDSFLQLFKTNLRENLAQSMNLIRVSLSSMKKSHLKKVHNLVSDEISDKDTNFKFSQWYYVIIDIIESKLYKPPKDKPARGSCKSVCKVYFDNKGIELINLPRILRDNSLAETLPSTPTKFSIPMVAYKLQNPIGSEIFNFNKFVKNLDVDAFLGDENTLPCNCDNSPFVDTHHRHIVTGNLKIIRNNKLRKLLTKGPKYRECNNINWDKARDCIYSGIQDYIAKCGVQRMLCKKL